MVGALSDDARLTSVCLTSVCLSVVYIGPKSRTERPGKTKIGTEVGHVTRDLDTTFKVKRSKVNLQGRGILWRPPAEIVIFAELQSCHPYQASKYLSVLRETDSSFSSNITWLHFENDKGNSYCKTLFAKLQATLH